MKTIIALSVVLAFGGCANYRPLVDTKGADMSRYESDLGECQRYAESESPVADTAIGAGLGALLGFAVAAAAGSRFDRSASAKAGAVLGGASGAGRGAQTQINIINTCMRGRGYKVLR